MALSSKKSTPWPHYPNRPMSEPSIHDLTEIAKSLGLQWSKSRLEDVLPEVQRIWSHARKLRELLARADEPMTRFHPR